MADNQNNKSIFELPEYKIYQKNYLQRGVTFARYRRYADGTVYQESMFRLAHKLYAQTRAIYLFLPRVIELDVALVPGVMGPWDLADGTPPQIRTAQAQLYEWSTWPTAGNDWLEDGTTNGETYLKIVPMPGMIQLQRLQPQYTLLTKTLDLESGAPSDLCLIVNPDAQEVDGTTYEYAEVLTPAEIRTYRNGDPASYNGNPDRYPNPLGFVPVIEAKNDTSCRPTFAKVLGQLDSVNELASYINDVIGRNADPQWALFGEDAFQPVRGNNIWLIPNSDSKLQAIVPQIDVEGSLKFIQEIKAEVKASLPELAFDDLRAKNQIATETLEVQLTELDSKIWKMRRRYDQALINAHHMAAMAGGIMGVSGLAPLLAPHRMDFKRPVRPISEAEQISLEQARLGLSMQLSVASGERLTGALNR